MTLTQTDDCIYQLGTILCVYNFFYARSVCSWTSFYLVVFVVVFSHLYNWQWEKDKLPTFFQPFITPMWAQDIHYQENPQPSWCQPGWSAANNSETTSGICQSSDLAWKCDSVSRTRKLKVLVCKLVWVSSCHTCSAGSQCCTVFKKTDKSNGEEVFCVCQDRWKLYTPVFRLMLGLV